MTQIRLSKKPAKSGTIWIIRFSRYKIDSSKIWGVNSFGTEESPKFCKKQMKDVDIVVENRASVDVLSETGLWSSFQLVGLYQGIPLDRTGFYHGNVPPDKITLFQIPIDSVCQTKEKIKEKIREVVMHEVGHPFGLNEERLRQLERDERLEWHLPKFLPLTRNLFTYGFLTVEKV